MNTKPPMFSDVYMAVSLDDQARLLALFLQAMTVYSREAYPEVSPDYSAQERFESLREINEIQHRVSGHLAKLLLGDSARYPDQVLCQIVTPATTANILVDKCLSGAAELALTGFNTFKSRQH